MTEPRDTTARTYMDDAYREMQNGGCPAGFAGKAVAHVFDDSSDALRHDILAMIDAVDTYLATYSPDAAAETHGDYYVTAVKDAIRFWRTHERPAYLASRHARPRTAMLRLPNMPEVGPFPIVEGR